MSFVHILRRLCRERGGGGSVLPFSFIKFYKTFYQNFIKFYKNSWLGYVAHLNFKTSRVGIYKCLSLIVGFSVTVTIWPREVVSCRDFILCTVATFWATLLVGIYPGRASLINVIGWSGFPSRLGKSPQVEVSSIKLLQNTN